MIDLSRPVETLEYLLALPAEQPLIEFKRLGRGFDRIAESVCAFANADGGWLILGLGDPKAARAGFPASDRLYGVEENPETLDQWKQLVVTRFTPPIDNLEFHTLRCTLRDDRPGRLCLVKVEASERVHSILGGGTWIRGDASNRQLSAEEASTLSLRRGTNSAETDVLPISLALLETDAWRSFLSARDMRPGDIGERLERIGLACRNESAGGVIQPRRAAVLLFAEEPGSLLAAHGSRADIRLMVYSGTEIGSGVNPNLKRRKTFTGPLIQLIAKAVGAVLDELSQGVTIEGSGFVTRHKYPERVVTEAIVNAVIHRDYRLNRDIVVRILDDKIIIESPGVFPGRITAANIKSARSKARNPLLVKHLRDFPKGPNFDDGEGVRMMYNLMDEAALYPPKYREETEAAVELVELTLVNEDRPAAWTEVSDWIDRNGPIANAEVRRIAKVDTLRASKMLKGWVDLGYLVPEEGRGRRNAAYGKPKASP